MVKRNLRATVLISGSGSNLQALIDALPTTLSNCTITSVISSRSDAYGLTRADSHQIPNEPFPLLRWKKLPHHNEGKKSREEWELELSEKVKETRPDLIVLAGWMLILSEKFLRNLTHDWEDDNFEEGRLPRESKVVSLVEGKSCIPSLSTPGEPLYPSTSSSSPSDNESSTSTTTPSRFSIYQKPIPIINLHPALPGQFPGAHAIKDAWEAFNVPSDETFVTSKMQHVKETLKTLNSLSIGGSSKEKEELEEEEEKEKSGETIKRRITKTGLMIHRVIPLLDAGEPIIVKEVPMVEGESLEELEQRIHKVEHEAIVEAVEECYRLITSGKWWDEKKDVGRE